MFKSAKAKLAALGAAVMATAANAATAPDWAPADSTIGFDGVLSYAAPIAIGVVVGVAGVRVVIKLINRGAGK